MWRLRNRILSVYCNYIKGHVVMTAFKVLAGGIHKQHKPFAGKGGSQKDRGQPLPRSFCVVPVVAEFLLFVITTCGYKSKLLSQK